MSHNLEMINGEAAMAYAYRSAADTPWHRLGTPVPADLTPEQMLKAAKLDWTVDGVPLFADVGDRKIKTGHKALVRSSDNYVIDVVTEDWNPVQNYEAFEFFNDFVAAGHMEMDTAGSLRNGRIVWALAKVNESFDLFGGKDRIDNYLLFTNPHQYGQSIDIRATNIRAVCNNTLTAALHTKSKNVVKVNHRSVFDAEKVKEVMGASKARLQEYREAAEFLSQKRAKHEDIVSYFKRVFPVIGEAPEKEISKSAERAISVLETQPGAEFGRGTWWQAMNAATYFVDHLAGRTDDTRLASAWYGQGARTKQNSMKHALEAAS